MDDGISLVSGPVSMYAFHMPKLNRYFYLFGDQHNSNTNVCTPEDSERGHKYLSIYKLTSKYIKANKSGSPIDVFVEAPYECPVYEKLEKRRQKNSEDYYVRAIDILNMNTEYPLNVFVKKLIRYGYYADKPTNTDDSVLRVHFTNLRSFKYRAPYAISKALVKKMYEAQDPITYITTIYQKQYGKFKSNHKIIKQVNANDPKVVSIIISECERLFYKNMKADLELVRTIENTNRHVMREIKAGREDADPNSDEARGRFTIEDCIMIAEQVYTNSRDIMVESYTLLRMFRKFNTTGKKQYCTKIIAYYGNAHIQVFMSIIEKLRKASPMYSISNIYSYNPRIKPGGQPNRCIPVPKRIQPFFKSK